MRGNKAEKRGARYLENPPKPRTYKNPVSAYVHYKSVGGDLVAFEVTLCSAAIAKLDRQAKHPSNIVPHSVYLKLQPGARLITLPSGVPA